MRSAKSLLLASLVAVALAGFGGCACPCRVPVSLEPLNNWLLYHGRACRHYPFSCPPCPYTGCEDRVQTDGYLEESSETVPATPRESADKAPPGK
jgi:hypothetical protein